VRCCDVIDDVIVVARCHVGGILNENKNIAKIRKAENFVAKVIHTPRTSTGVYIIPHTTVCQHVHIYSNVTIATYSSTNTYA